MKMKVFCCKDFEGRWPVGVSSIIVDVDEETARISLETKLKEMGLTGQKPDGGIITLQEISIKKAQVVVLQDGDY